jgi:hypothetical protein
MSEEERPGRADDEPPQMRQKPGSFDLNLHLPDLAKVAGSCERVINNLVNAISIGVGRLYTPRGIIRNAQAESEATLIRARAVVELAKMADGIIHNGSTATVQRRAIERLVDEAVSKQANREWVAREAAREIVQEPPSSDAEQEIGADWLAQFWTVAEAISEADARRFLAHLLANEVKRPGSVSPQTLSLLTILTGALARRFQHFCRLSIDDGDAVYVIHPNVFNFQNIGPLDDFGVSYNDLFDFDDCGLLRSAETLMVNYAPNPEATPYIADYAGQKAVLRLAGGQFHLLQFTRAGREIRRLLSLTPVPTYTQALQNKFGSVFALDQDDENQAI